MRYEGVIATAPVEADTNYVEAGGVTIGVERRTLDAATVLAVMDQRNVRDEERDQYLTEMPHVKAGGAEQFLSVHVFGPDRSEYLRFDNIDGGRTPHYHYLAPQENFYTVESYDVEANGNFIDWTLHCLQNHLEPMLRKAHADDVADEIDRLALDAALVEVRELVVNS